MTHFKKTAIAMGVMPIETEAEEDFDDYLREAIVITRS